METKPTKAIIAAVSLVVTALTGIYSDNVFGWDEVGNLISVIVEAALGAYAVWRVTNKPVS